MEHDSPWIRLVWPELDLIGPIVAATLLAEYVRRRKGRTLLWGWIAAAGYVPLRLGVVAPFRCQERILLCWKSLLSSWCWLMLVGICIWLLHRNRSPQRIS